LSFSNDLQPRVTPIIRHICREFAQEAETELVSLMRDVALSEELESQELCLLKHDYLSDLKAATQSGDPTVDMLGRVSQAFPLQSSR